MLKNSVINVIVDINLLICFLFGLFQFGNSFEFCTSVFSTFAKCTQSILISLQRYTPNGNSDNSKSYLLDTVSVLDSPQNAIVHFLYQLFKVKLKIHIIFRWRAVITSDLLSIHSSILFHKQMFGWWLVTRRWDASFSVASCIQLNSINIGSRWM